MFFLLLKKKVFMYGFSIVLWAARRAEASPTAIERNAFVSPIILLNLKNCARPFHGSYVERGPFFVGRKSQDLKTLPYLVGLFCQILNTNESAFCAI